MRRPPRLCPLHMYQRARCNKKCADARRVLTKIGSDLRQYWYDRRHGVRPISPGEWRIRYGVWP